MSGTVSLLPPAEQQFCDANGAPLAGGSVATYIPGTTTPSATWQDAGGTVPNTNPIVLDAAGRAIIWGAGSYRMVVKDVSGNLIYDQVTAAAGTTFSSLTTTGNLSVGGALAVTGNSSLTGTLTVGGVSNLTVLDIAQDGGGTTTLPTAIDVTRVAGTAADSDLVDITQTVTHVAGANTLAQALQVQSTVGNTYIGGVLSDGPATNVWNLSARLYSSALRSSSAGSVDSQHVSLQVRAERSLPTGGVPAGKQMAEVWASYIPVNDSTNLPSSVTNALVGSEMDCGANNVDDTNARQGHVVVVGPQVALTSGGYPCEWSRAFSMSGFADGSGNITGFCKWGIWAGMAYSISMLDCRPGSPMNTTVATSLGVPSTTVAVAHVWGFTCGANGAPVSPTNTAPITINGTPYTQTGFTPTAGSVAGTITLSSAVSTTDGTAGHAVVGQSRTIWLATNQQIALSSDGTAYMYVDSDGAFNFVTFSGLLMKLSAGGEVVAQGAMTVQDGLGLFGKTPGTQQTITGSRSSATVAVLTELLTALDAMGIIKDNTTT